MNVRYSLFGAVALASVLAACGGGSTPGLPASSGGSGPAPGAPVSQSVSPASGGTLSVAFLGGGSAALTIPAGALSKATTVTLTGVTFAGALPKTFSSTARKTQSVPSGSTFLAGFTVDLGGATLLKPLQLSETFSGISVPAGNVVRLAMYSTKVGSYTDVDTATNSGSTVTNNLAKGYVAISSGTGASNPYAFYAVPSASAATPAPLVLTATPSTPAPYQINGGTVTYTASGADANGQPYAFPAAAFSIASTDPSGDKVVASTTNPLQADVTLGIGTGTMVVTDPYSGQSATVTVPILPQRPGATGDTFTYSGTLARSDVYAYPSPTLPPSSANANVTQTITTTNTTDPTYLGANVLFSNVENDAYPLQTLSSTTTMGFLSNFTTFNLIGYFVQDDIGDTTSYVYNTPQIADQLPEAAGASWTNSPAATVTQNFAGTAAATRTINADGSYTDSELVAAPNPSATNYPAVNALITENADGSGSYKLTFHENGRPGRTNQDVIDNYVLSAPTGGNITYSYQNYAITSPTAPTPAPRPQYSFASWIPAGAPLYSETNTQSGSTPIPASCNVPSALGANGNKLQQGVTAIDTVLGTITTTTTTQYVIAGFGPACVQMASNIVAYYDYNLDFTTFSQAPFSVAFGNTPLQTTTISETLAQPAGNPVLQSSGRKTQSVSLAPISAFAIANARATIERTLQRDRGKRVQAIVRQLQKQAASEGAR
jgi:hypothetical protein